MARDQPLVIVISSGDAGSIWSYPNPLEEFGPGSSQRLILEQSVSDFALDGAGSGGGPGHRRQPHPLRPGLDDSAVNADAPADLIPREGAPFAVDGAGWVVVLDTGNSLMHFAPGSTTAMPLGGSIKSFGIDDSGSVVELTSGGVLNLLAPGSRSNPPQQLGTGVSEFAVDATGQVYWLSSGVLTRREGSTEDSLGSDVQSFSLNADGTFSVVRSSWQDTIPTRAIVNPSNAPIPPSLLACTGEVSTPTEIGSGTLLSAGANYFVLTALHVVADYANSPQGITFQLPTLGGTYYVRKVIPVILPDGPLDLALLELTSPVLHVQGASLPGPLTSFYGGPGQPVVQVGYGLTNDGSYGRNSTASLASHRSQVPTSSTTPTLARVRLPKVIRAAQTLSGSSTRLPHQTCLITARSTTFRSFSASTIWCRSTARSTHLGTRRIAWRSPRPWRRGSTSMLTRSSDGPLPPRRRVSAPPP